MVALFCIFTPSVVSDFLSRYQTSPLPVQVCLESLSAVAFYLAVHCLVPGHVYQFLFHVFHEIHCRPVWSAMLLSRSPCFTILSWLSTVIILSDQHCSSSLLPFLVIPKSPRHFCLSRVFSSLFFAEDWKGCLLYHLSLWFIVFPAPVVWLVMQKWTVFSPDQVSLASSSTVLTRSER